MTQKKDDFYSEMGDPAYSQEHSLTLLVPSDIQRVTNDLGSVFVRLVRLDVM